MAAHQWAEYIPPEWGTAQKLTHDPKRKCSACGIIQTKHTHTAWMRVTGYQWLPLAGRCKGSMLN